MNNNETNKKELTIDEVVKMYDGGLKLQDIADRCNSSKSTIQRIFTKSGYVFNKKTKKYEKNNIDNDTIVNEGNVSLKSNVSRETIKCENMVNRTYLISEKIDRAIKIKSAIEGKKPIDVVREALDNYIEDKYWNL